MSEENLKQLSEITGLKRADMDEIFKKVKANSKALSECPGPHVFTRNPGENPLRAKYKCSVCKGEVDGIGHTWYQLGLEHGRLK